MSRAARSPLPWLGGLLLVYLVVPVAAFAVRAGASPQPAAHSAGLSGALLVSVATASIATGIIAVCGVPLGYLLSRGRGRTSQLLGLVVQLPLALPPLMSGILLLYLVGPYTPVGSLFGGRLTDSLAGIVLAQTFVAAPFGVVAARSAFAAVDPALDDVAATLGHRRWARFARVALPAAAPGVGAGLLLSWLRAFGEFGATVVLAYHPYTLPVYTFVEFGSTGLTATLAPVAAALVAAFALLVLARIMPRLARPRSRIRPPSPRPPAGTPGARLGFDLDARLGGFHLRLSHEASGRHLAVLGPSGAGKTFALRLLAGLAAAESSRVRIDGREITGLPPEQRRMGYVPQDASLLPHQPVWRQATFGVGADPALVAYWLSALHLSGLEDRRPDELSGGQRRRVALARALATSPRLLLLDEPFTALDTPVRDELRHELRRLQRDTGLSTVLVTHDPAEAALLAGEILIIDEGRLLQAGPQPDVFAHPASPAAARLLGVRNVRSGRLVNDSRIASGAVEIAADTPAAAGTPVTWCIRPEHITLDDAGAYAATVIDAADLGTHREVLVDLGGLQLTAHTRNRPEVGAACRVHLPPGDIVVWTSETAGTRTGCGQTARATVLVPGVTRTALGAGSGT